jgi:hypothetical protein
MARLWRRRIKLSYDRIATENGIKALNRAIDAERLANRLAWEAMEVGGEPIQLEEVIKDLKMENAEDEQEMGEMEEEANKDILEQINKRFEEDSRRQHDKRQRMNK